MTATKRYVTTIDHDSIFELVGDTTEPESAIVAFLRMSHDANATVSDVRIERPLDHSLTWATVTFLSFTATPADVTALASRYSASDDDGPFTYVDYLRLRS